MFFQVGTNGYFSFDKVFTDYATFEFPGIGDVTLVAPFFSDIDISDGIGSISYEVHTRRTSQSLISKIDTIINDQMSTQFSGSWLIIAEWKNVPQFGRSHVFVSGMLIRAGSRDLKKGGFLVTPIATPTQIGVVMGVALLFK